MTYVYRPGAAESADALAKALKGKRIVSLSGATFQKGDVVLCWGAQCAEIGGGVTVLNGPSLKRKSTDIRLLTKAGVRTVETSRTRPVGIGDPIFKLVVALRDQIGTIADRGDVVRLLPDLGKRLSALKTESAKAWKDPIEWLGREDDHSRGTDLISPPKKPDYWVKREEFVTEYRVHAFDGYSIRAGEKVKSSKTKTHHPWIKSWETGWDLSYVGVTPKVRAIAIAAIKALGLTFGAVDIGETAKGELVVLEVNRAPALDGGEIPAYVRAFERWVRA